MWSTTERGSKLSAPILWDIQSQRTTATPGTPCLILLRIQCVGSLTSQRIMNIEELWDGAYSLSSLSEKTWKSNHLQMSLQRLHFLLRNFKTLSGSSGEVWIRDLAHIKKKTFALELRDDSMLLMRMTKEAKCGFIWFAQMVFDQVRSKESKIYCCGLVLSSEPQISKIHVVICQTTSNIFTKKRATCGTTIFPHSTNHIIDFWCDLRCCCRRFLNSLKPFSSHLRLINLGVAGKLNLQEFTDSLTTFIQYGWNNGSFDVRYDVAAQPVLARNTTG